MSFSAATLSAAPALRINTSGAAGATGADFDTATCVGFSAAVANKDEPLSLSLPLVKASTMTLRIATTTAIFHSVGNLCGVASGRQANSRSGLLEDEVI